MSRRRFFVESIRHGQAEISGEDARHLTRVLRVETGQLYEISDNHQVWLAEVEAAHKERVVFRTVQRLAPQPDSVRLVLLAALIKFDRYEWMIEKATELGVAGIVPVVAARSERGLDRATAKRLSRWRKIALESSQQSRRDHLPEVNPPAPFSTALTHAASRRYALDEQPGAPALLDALPPERSAADSVALLVGPEGGWTDEERAAFTTAGWQPVSLGPRILRTETAALAALAIVSAAWPPVSASARPPCPPADRQ